MPTDRRTNEASMNTSFQLFNTAGYHQIHYITSDTFSQSKHFTLQWVASAGKYFAGRSGMLVSAETVISRALVQSPDPAE